MKFFEGFFGAKKLLQDLPSCSGPIRLMALPRVGSGPWSGSNKSLSVWSPSVSYHSSPVVSLPLRIPEALKAVTDAMVPGVELAGRGRRISKGKVA